MQSYNITSPWQTEDDQQHRDISKPYKLTILHTYLNMNIVIFIDTKMQTNEETSLLTIPNNNVVIWL